MIKWIKQVFKPRTHCRVCGTKLHKPGGVLLPFVGRGFCQRCAGEIMKLERRC